MIIAVLATLLLPASAADFVPPSPAEVVSRARSVVAQSELEAFLANLGAAVYQGTSGSFSRDGQAYALIETRVIVQRKVIHGHPGATLRLLRRAALASNPAHVETLGAELSLEASNGTLLVLRDGKPGVAARLEKAPSASNVIATYRDAPYRHHPEVAETLTLAVAGGTLRVERLRLVSGAESERESFAAARR